MGDTNVCQSIQAEAAGISAQIVGWRRGIHSNPELGFREHATARLVADALRAMGVSVQEGGAREETLRPVLERLEIQFVEGMGGTAVIGEIRGGKPGKTVALRADMDALPLSESTDGGHAPAANGCASSRHGVMHACGHDAHTAILLGAARLLARRREGLRGTVRLVFQPAEENGNGAEVLVREGVMRGVDAVFGLHVWSSIPAGQVAVNDGPVLASSSVLKASFSGGGGHGSLPHEAGDPLLASCEFVEAFYRGMRSGLDPRRPATATITRIEAGSTWNVIPSVSRMEGTFRVFDDETRGRLLDVARRAGECAARFHGLEFSMGDVLVCPPTTNDPRMARIARAAAVETCGADAVASTPPTMGGEDFSYYLREVPGAFLLLGSRNEARGITAPHHNPRFDVDEEVLPRGAALLAGTALRFLESL